MVTPKWGQCQQPAWADSPEGRCRSHEAWALKPGATIDNSYHEKIVKGLLQPTWSYLSESEMEATVNGRYRGDGRRLDQYIVDDPLLVEYDDPTVAHP